MVNSFRTGSISRRVTLVPLSKRIYYKKKKKLEILSSNRKTAFLVHIPSSTYGLEGNRKQQKNHFNE